MDVYDAAKRMVCNIIAVALSMTVASVEGHLAVNAAVARAG